MDREFYYCWETDLEATPEEYWPLIADTNRFNKDTGLPTLTNLRHEAAEGELQNARRKLRIFRFGVPVTWVEEPFEWVRPYRFGVLRRYSSGPVAEMRVLAKLHPKEDGGTHFSYEVWVKPKNILGLLAIPIQVGWLSGRAFRQAFAEYEQIARGEQEYVQLGSRPQLAPGGAQRMDALRAELAAQIEDQDAAALIEQLLEIISRADDLTVAQLRPYAMADFWEADRTTTLKTFLHATRAGLLDFRWHLLCPSCRVSKGSATTLKEIPREVHCETCLIDFEINFEQAVELTFRPNPTIRAVDEHVDFCIAGPQITPHIVAQQLIPAHESRVIEPQLETGRYRVRTLEHEGAQYIRAEATGAPDVVLTQQETGWGEHELSMSLTPTLTLTNQIDEERLFILERVQWSDQAATAAEVTALQTFRDLFSNEALKPGEQFSVGKLAIAFTDLRASTRMYLDIGDATAFGYVLNHFNILRDAILEENGALVKTIGDAVMAVFQRPVEALRALEKAQDRLANPPEGILPQQLKGGIHFGPCIAVTLNDRLDYFGTTINLAARLVDISNGENLIFSQAVFDDPEVNAHLSDRGVVEAFMTNALKGFEDQPVELYRYTQWEDEFSAQETSEVLPEAERDNDPPSDNT